MPTPDRTPPPPSSHADQSRRGDFEDLPWTGITVVVAVIGLFLIMAIPLRGPSPSERLATARARAAHVALTGFQNAIEDYRGDHGAWPGQDPATARSLSQPVHDARSLVRQLQMHSDLHGSTLPTSEGAHTFGPYLPNGIPTNPANGLTTVRLLQPGESADQVLDGVYGWIYNPRNGVLHEHLLPFQRSLKHRKSQRNVGSKR